MQITTVMVVILLVWGGDHLARAAWQLPPFPAPRTCTSLPRPSGFLRTHSSGAVPALGIMMAFGHSVLAMSGEESSPRSIAKSLIRS